MSDAKSCEVNFDGIVGLSHNYSGLSYGNVASSAHGGLISSPRAAALQGLEKMMELQQRKRELAKAAFVKKTEKERQEMRKADLSLLLSLTSLV